MTQKTSLDKHQGLSNIHITIELRGPCNYHCFYCCANHIPERLFFHNINDLKKIYDRFRSSFILTSFEYGGSEPIIHPQFRDLLELCVQYGACEIFTNNSIDPEHWLPRNNPERLMVFADLHPEGEKDLDGFLHRLRYIRDRGAQVGVLFVAHPSRFKDVEAYYEIFSRNHIHMDLLAYTGTYQGKNYPEAYSQEEMVYFRECRDTKSHLQRDASKYDPTFPNWMRWYNKLNPDISVRDYSGIPCLGGYSTFHIGESGKLQRCVYDYTPLNDLLSGPEPCSIKNCGCGLVLEELNYYDDNFWTFYRKLAGWPISGKELHQDPGELYQEKRRKYFQMMEQYGKIRDDTGRGRSPRTEFIHVIFDRDEEALNQLFERNFYGPVNENNGLRITGSGYLFIPTSPRDVLATPLFEGVQRDKNGGSLLKITLQMNRDTTLENNLIMYVQDQHCNRISDFILPLDPPLLPDSERETVTFHRIVRFIEKSSKIRLLLSTKNGEPAYLPKSIRIEQSSRASDTGEVSSATLIQWAQMPDDAIDFQYIPYVKELSLKKIGGRPGESDGFWDYMLNLYTDKDREFNRVLSLCCGFGRFERLLATMRKFRSCDAYDVVSEALESAKRSAREADIQNINYAIMDLNQARFHHDYDLVIGGGIHHIRNLEHLFSEISDHLTEDGLFLMYEYIGPSQSQPTRRQVEIINSCIRLIPPRYRVRISAQRDLNAINPEEAFRIMREKNLDPTGYLWNEYTPMTREQWDIHDPSEAVRSNEIIPLLKKYFNEVDVRYTGGSILQFTLYDIAANFLENTPESKAIIDMLWNIEQVATTYDDVPEDYAIIVARNKLV